MIKDEDQLSQIILPLYFNHTNLKSFIRQLNMYDFHKIRLTHRQHPCFYNPYFVKDKPELLKYIRRQSNWRHPKRVQKAEAKIKAKENDRKQTRLAASTKRTKPAPAKSLTISVESNSDHSSVSSKSYEPSEQQDSYRTPKKKTLLGKRPALKKSIP